MDQPKKEPERISFSLTELINNKYPHLYKAEEPEQIIEDKIDDQLIQNQESSDIEIDHSAFELNFAEFPIAHLSQRLPVEIDRFKIKYSDFIRGQDGVLVERKWTVKSSADHGLGGPSSIGVFMELMQIWKEQGFDKNKIYVGTYYNLLKRLGWETGGSNYKQLELDLQSLYGLEIEAENAYFDKEKGVYLDKKIKPFIGWEFWKANQIKDYMTDYGYIQVNQEFFEEFKKKSLYYLPFDNIYFKKLSAHEQKLALYLTKIFNPYRRKVQYKYCRNIENICSLLPIYGQDKYKRKFYLIKACKGLIKKDFILLENFKIEEDQITFFNKQQTSLLSKLNPKAGIKTKVQIDILIEDQLKICRDVHSKNFYSLIAKVVPDDIIFECLSEAKQEGNPPRKLYTKLIKEKAKKYLEKYIKISSYETAEMSIEDQEIIQKKLDEEQEKIIKNEKDEIDRIRHEIEREITDSIFPPYKGEIN